MSKELEDKIGDHEAHFESSGGNSSKHNNPINEQSQWHDIRKIDEGPHARIHFQWDYSDDILERLLSNNSKLCVHFTDTQPILDVVNLCVDELATMKKILIINFRLNLMICHYC